MCFEPLIKVILLDCLIIYVRYSIYITAIKPLRFLVFHYFKFWDVIHCRSQGGIVPISCEDCSTVFIDHPSNITNWRQLRVYSPVHAPLPQGVLDAIQRKYPNIPQPPLQKTDYVRCKLWDKSLGDICCKYRALNKIPMARSPRSEAYTLLCNNTNNQLCVETYMRDYPSPTYFLTISHELNTNNRIEIREAICETHKENLADYKHYWSMEFENNYRDIIVKNPNTINTNTNTNTN